MRFVDVSQDRWEVGLAHLREYTRSRGSASVPQRYITDDGFPLGVWVAVLRRRRLSLPIARVKALEELAGWSWDRKDDRWRTLYDHLVEYFAGGGLAVDMGAHSSPDGYPLGERAEYARRAYRRGWIPAYWVERLSRLAGWTWDTAADAWEEGLRRLEAYQQREGNARVSYRYADPDGFALGMWAARQRRMYRRGTLAPQLAARLKLVPTWAWDRWDDAMNELDLYEAEHGDLMVPATYVSPTGYHLGKWVATRRADFRSGVLGRGQAESLSGRPNWVWGVHDDSWQEFLRELRAYLERERHGHMHHRHVTESGYPLGKKVSYYRTRRRKLPPDRVVELESMPGWSWDNKEDAWQEGLDQLRAYVAREGHARVPSSYVTDSGHQLGRWVSRQRTQHRKDKMPADRVVELESIPGWTWSTKEDAWQEGLHQLRAYVDREGHARVPSSYVTDSGHHLGKWVSRQRTQFSNGKLSADQAAELESLPDWSWDTKEDAWQEGLHQLRAYVDRQGHARVPKRYATTSGYRLGLWVMGQRAKHAKGDAIRRSVRGTQQHRGLGVEGQLIATDSQPDVVRRVVVQVVLAPPVPLRRPGVGVAGSPLDEVERCPALERQGDERRPQAVRPQAGLAHRLEPPPDDVVDGTVGQWMPTWDVAPTS